MEAFSVRPLASVADIAKDNDVGSGCDDTGLENDSIDRGGQMDPSRVCRGAQPVDSCDSVQRLSGRGPGGVEAGPDAGDPECRGVSRLSPGARTVQAVRARQGAVGARKGDRVAAAAAAAGAVGAAVAQAYAERASNVPVLVTLVWLGLGFMTGAFLFLVIHGDRTSVAAGRGTG
jgi:hypothetical protein